MSVQIRQANLDDAPLLAKMNDRLVEDQGSENPFSLLELEQRFSEWLQTDEYQIDLFVQDREVLGYAVYQHRRDYYNAQQQVVYIRHFYIERAWRGQGVGSIAFERLTQERFPTKCAVALDVVATNPDGQNFWEKLGFTPYFVAMKKE